MPSRSKYDYTEFLHALYKVRGANRWDFLRRVSVPKDYNSSFDYVVFEVERILNGEKDTVRYAANHEKMVELESTQFPSGEI